jgi:hypothetical protein
MKRIRCGAANGVEAHPSQNRRRMQAEFPDCEALRQVKQDRWQRLRIEFEFESLNFVKHGHDVKGCDMIVCWKHNWPECPLEVVELSKFVGKFLPQIEKA